MTCDTSRRFRPITRAWSATACLLIVAQTGCTSALTASYLRNGLWEHDEHAAAVPEAAPDDDTAPAGTAAEPASPAVAADPEADRERREAALEEAMSRLSRLGTLTPAAEAALVATLQKTQPEDWPVVVEEFAASLPATPVAPEESAAAAAEPPTAEAVADAPEAAAPDAAVTDTVADTVTDAEPEPAPDETPEPDAESPVPPPSFTVRSACFASAVRAWGEVDRFPSDRFQPGQEVIVYVELENLAANESPAGHTTCIDAALTLVDDADRTLHAWSFDPVAETSAGRRHDYFARYVVRIPDSTPAGGCRVELAVTDTLAGRTATTTLPLEIAAAD